MKVIERQIRNHEFEIQFDPTTVSTTDPPFCNDAKFIVDGISVIRGDFLAALSLLSAEAPK